MSLEDARNSALQKIGRNLVNIQKLEGMLKLLLATNHLEGHPSLLAEKAKSRSAKVSRMTMGPVIQELQTSLFDNCGIAQGRLELSSEPWITSRFILEGGADAANQWKREMEAIVAARNELVHHMLIKFDPHSIESCQDLSMALDSQREQLMPVYEHVQSLIVARNEAIEDISRKL